MQFLMLYFILISILPFLANFIGFIISVWSCTELDSLQKYFDYAARIVFILSLALVLSYFKLVGVLILVIFMLFALSKYFWTHEKMVLLVYAILVVLNPSVMLLILLFIYFVITSSQTYYKFHKTNPIRISIYPLHAINFMKRYWTYYLFVLIVNIILLVLVSV